MEGQVKKTVTRSYMPRLRSARSGMRRSRPASTQPIAARSASAQPISSRSTPTHSASAGTTSTRSTPSSRPTATVRPHIEITSTPTPSVNNTKIFTPKVARRATHVKAKQQKSAVAPKQSRSRRTLLPKSPRRRPYRHPSIKLPTWRSPIIEYWEARMRRRRSEPRQKAPRRLRQERQILIMLAAFSISIGIWENFRQLWLQGNGFSAPEVSNILSSGMLSSVLGIILVGKIVHMSKIKIFMTIILIARSATLFVLFCLDGTGMEFLLAALSAVEVVTGALIVTSVYPLLTTVMKSNNAYSRRKLVEYLFRDIGMLIGGILIGQQFGGWIMDYNACLVVAMTFSAVAAIIMGRFELTLNERTPQQKNHFSAVKFVLHYKVHSLYMVYVFLASAAYYSAIGLRMLILTDFFDFSAGMATVYLLAVGLLSDVLGILALRQFTPKDDYTTMLIKFGTRLVLYMAAFVSGNFFFCFIAMTWTLLSSTVYENITDGYYINAADNRYQLKYNTLRYVIAYSGEALGVFISGQIFHLGPSYMLGMSGLLVVLQLIVTFRLIHERKTYGFRRTISYKWLHRPEKLPAAKLVETSHKR